MGARSEKRSTGLPIVTFAACLAFMGAIVLGLL